jgi:gamma-glutamyl:cysteine ligase YbdK (ATP-grasp superfamily)
VSKLSLFDAVGVELEYMIVDSKRFNIRAIADRLLVDRDGDPVSDLEFGPIAWSNELVNHVVELKTSGPAKSLAGLDELFHQNVIAANKRLSAFGARLMPTAMHPWMNPDREKQLWLGDSTEIYQLFDQIFDCSGHGWSNLQSIHINLPFSGDQEFGKLHAAIRLLLPILPGLAASSPIHDGKRSQYADARLQFYIHHCDAIPAVAGLVIPEPVFSKQAYSEQIFAPMYREIAPQDPDEILQQEFLNARGAIARFERGSIEIRLLDVQECPKADLAIVALVVESLRYLVAETTSTYEQQQAFEAQSLRTILDRTIASGGAAEIYDSAYLTALLGGHVASPMTAADLWQEIYNRVGKSKNALDEGSKTAIETLLGLGTLSERIVKACENDYSPNKLKLVYARLCDCLAENRFLS